jgi:hypothetical protein
MKQIGVQFGDKQVLQIKDLAEASGFASSRVARAAMQIGLKAIRDSEGERDKLIALNDLKAIN